MSRNRALRDSLSLRGSDWSNDNGSLLSQKSQGLHLTSSRKTVPRVDRRSLSLIVNKSVQKREASQHANASTKNIGPLTEDMAWNIIDREIFEWQYVCRTGRPYWWSPESKFGRFKKFQPRLIHSPNHRIGTKELDEGPKPDYSVVRRAMSDSYLADKAKVDDLVHLVAVQLLSACFTIPPNNCGMTVPNYKTLDSPKFCGSTDPGMISSLRMHTHFRYSPAFGYQARNPSPVDQWPSISYGGAHPMFWLRDSQDNSTQTSDMLFNFTQRRRLQRSESSLSSSSYENIDGDDTESFGSGDAADEYDVNKPMVNGRLAKRSTSQSPRAAAAANSHKADGVVQASRSSRFFNKRNLHSVIHSEPHPVYVQPVKELVVTKWRSLRRRVGDSLQTLLPGDSSSVDHESGSTASAPVASESSNCPPSSDDRDCRRLVRERGDIISSSTEGDPKYNSPASTMSLPGIPHYNTPERAESPEMDGWGNTGVRLSPSFPAYGTIDSLDSTYKSTDSIFTRNPRRTSSPPTPTPMMSDSGFFIPKRANSNTPSFVPRNPRRIGHRKSMLSEVCTPDDFQEEEESPYFSPSTESDNEVIDRGLLSVAGSALSGPIEELASLPGFSVEEVLSKAAEEEERTRIRQSMGINSSGSQVFTPNADGLEVGGRPVGPGKEIWGAPGGKGKRKQLR